MSKDIEEEPSEERPNGKSEGMFSVRRRSRGNQNESPKRLHDDPTRGGEDNLQMKMPAPSSFFFCPYQTNLPVHSLLLSARQSVSSFSSFFSFSLARQSLPPNCFTTDSVGSFLTISKQAQVAGRQAWWGRGKAWQNKKKKYNNGMVAGRRVMASRKKAKAGARHRRWQAGRVRENGLFSSESPVVLVVLSLEMDDERIAATKNARDRSSYPV